jgi:cob(I)alamin adenosyltransferase
MVLHDDMHTRSGKAVTAIQFHDRLVQCLTHVCSSLTYLGQFMASGSTARSEAQWNELRERVREIHSMEQERVLFDLLAGSASSAEKQTATSSRPGSAGGAGEVELF